MSQSTKRKCSREPESDKPPETEWSRYKERMRLHVLHYDVALPPTVRQLAFDTVFDSSIAKTVKQNADHIWCLEDATHGLKIVVAYIARISGVKRIRGKLNIHLREKGYHQDKLVTFRRGLEFFYDYVPPDCSTTMQKESFAGQFVVFVKDDTHAASLQPPSQIPWATECFDFSPEKQPWQKNAEPAAAAAAASAAAASLCSSLDFGLGAFLEGNSTDTWSSANLPSGQDQGPAADLNEHQDSPNYF